MSMHMPWGLSDEDVTRIQARQRRQAERKYRRYLAATTAKKYLLGVPATFGLLVWMAWMAVYDKIDDRRSARRSKGA